MKSPLVTATVVNSSLKMDIQGKRIFLFCLSCLLLVLRYHKMIIFFGILFDFIVCSVIQ